MADLPGAGTLISDIILVALIGYPKASARMTMTCFGVMDKKSNPLTTAPARSPPNRQTEESWAASIHTTRAAGNRYASSWTKAEPYSTSARRSSGMPRASS